MEESIKTNPNLTLKLNLASGEKEMNQDHEYYYQVQLLLIVTETKYGIFAMFTKRSLIHVRVEFDLVLKESIIGKC